MTSHTPDTTQGLDDALAILYNSAWVEGSNYEENNPEASKIPSDREARKTAATKQAILQWVADEVIREDEHYGPRLYKPARNELRNEQRATLKNTAGKESSDGNTYDQRTV